MIILRLTKFTWFHVIVSLNSWRLNSKKFIKCRQKTDAKSLAVNLGSYKNQSANQTAPSDYTKDKFSCDAENDLYRCPQGRQLSYFYTKTENNISIRIYRSDDCSHCAAHELCLRQGNKSKQRTLKIYETDNYIDQIRQKLKTDVGK